MNEKEKILKEFIRLFTKYDGNLFVTVHGDIEFQRSDKESIKVPRHIAEAKEMIKDERN